MYGMYSVLELNGLVTERKLFSVLSILSTLGFIILLFKKP